MKIKAKRNRKLIKSLKKRRNTKQTIGNKTNHKRNDKQNKNKQEMKKII